MEKLLIEAESLYDAGRFADAIALLTPFIILNSSHSKAYYLRAACRYGLWQEGDNPILDAQPILDDLTSAIALHPDHIDAYFLRAQAFAQSEPPNYAALAADVEIVLARSPTFGQAVRAIGFALLAFEQRGQITQVWVSSFAKAKQVLAYFDRWIALIRQFAATATAADATTAALHPRTEIDPRMGCALSEKARFLQRSNLSELALQCYVQALKHIPDDAQVLSETALLAFALQKYDFAADCFLGAAVWESQAASEEHTELLEKTISAGEVENPALYAAYSLLHMDTTYLRGELSNVGDPALFEKSIALAEKALVLDTTCNTANLALARAWGNLGNVEKSVYFFEKYFESANFGVFNQARYLCVRIKALLPFPANFSVTLDGEVAYDYYNTGVTINEFLNERRLDTDFVMPYRAFAQSAYLRACALFQAYLDRGEGSSINNHSHIAGMAHHNCANEIKPDYALALTYEETSIRYSAFYENLTGRARLLRQLERHDEASTAYFGVYGDALDFQCDDDAAIFHFGFWGDSLRQAKRYPEAISVLEKVLVDFVALPRQVQQSLQSEHRQYSDMVTDLAEAYSATDDWPAMRATFEKALQRLPKEAALWNNFGWNYHCFGKYEEAEKIYSAGLLACSSDTKVSAVLDLYINRGDLYWHHLHNTKQAAADYEKVFYISSSFGVAMRLVKLNIQISNWSQAFKWSEEADYYDYKNKIGDDVKLAELSALRAQIACEFGTRAQFVKAIDFAQKAIELDANQNSEALRALIKMAENKVSTMRKKFLGLF
jgi:tetratricopeptide (TPR) repeat protein